MLTFLVGSSQARPAARAVPVLRASAVPLLAWAWMVFVLAVPGRSAEAAGPVCADFLAQTHRKPPHVRFVGCRLVPDAQGRPMRATYRVEGRYAAGAEAFLARTIGLARLRRSCCLWDGPPAWFTDKNGRGFMLTMGSDETVANGRHQWRLIPGFTITVDAFTEEI